MGVFTAWGLAAGIQIYRDVGIQGRAPLPSEFVSSGAIFGVLALIDGPTQGLGGVVAWGLLVAITLQAGGPSALVHSGSLGGSLGGKLGKGLGQGLTGAKPISKKA